MTVVLDDSLSTSYLVHPITSGWVEPSLDFLVKTDVRAGSIGANDFAFLSATESALMKETHSVVTGLGIVCEQHGAIRMICPVRLDQIETTWIWLDAVSSVAEVLARALVWPFYGVHVDGWSRDNAHPESVVTVVDGPGAVDSIVSGYAEDLCTSWFVLTGLPVVTHVLVAPNAASAEEISIVTDELQRALKRGQEGRKELTRALAAQLDIERPLVAEFLRDQRYVVTSTDVSSLEALLYRGGGGTPYALKGPLSVAGNPQVMPDEAG